MWNIECYVCFYFESSTEAYGERWSMVILATRGSGLSKIEKRGEKVQLKSNLSAPKPKDMKLNQALFMLYLKYTVIWEPNYLFNYFFFKAAPKGKGYFYVNMRKIMSTKFFFN